MKGDDNEADEDVDDEEGDDDDVEEVEESDIWPTIVFVWSPVNLA